MTALRVATDVGGTFTDLVVQEIDSEGRLIAVHAEKTDTTPPTAAAMAIPASGIQLASAPISTMNALPLNAPKRFMDTWLDWERYDLSVS